MPVIIREGVVGDCKGIIAMIQELANYEKMPDAPKIDLQTLEKDGFGTESFYQCFVAEKQENSKLVGYVLYFFTYTSIEGKNIYMEDLYVTPQYRKIGIGKDLWKSVVKNGLERGCDSLNFAVLGWNEPSIEFYRSQQATDLTLQNRKHLLRFDKTTMSAIAAEI